MINTLKSGLIKILFLLICTINIFSLAQGVHPRLNGFNMGRLQTEPRLNTLKEDCIALIEQRRKKTLQEQLGLFYKNKQVLVTGGAGFIGGHLTEKLVSLGAHVTVLDNFATGNIKNLATVSSLITLQEGDITSPQDILTATQNKDIVFHLAAYVSVPGSIKQPTKCARINSEGTKNLLEACAINNVSRFIFSSSAAVYGERSDYCKETDAPNPQSPYAKTKLQGELYCKDYAEKYGLKTGVLRYFNVFGPRQNPKGAYAAVVAKFTQLLLNKKPLTIFGDGTQKRDFVAVEEVVKANLLLGMRDQLAGDIFNIGSGKSIDLFELITLLEQKLNVQRKGVTFEPARQGDILNSYASCAKYQNILALYQ